METTTDLSTIFKAGSQRNYSTSVFPLVLLKILKSQPKLLVVGNNAQQLALP